MTDENNKQFKSGWLDDLSAKAQISPEDIEKKVDDEILRKRHTEQVGTTTSRPAADKGR